MASKKRRRSIALAVVLGLLLGCVTGWLATADLRSYNQGMEYLNQGSYEEAAAVFESLEDFRDSAERLREARYPIADALLAEEAWLEAAEAFASLGDYLDSAEKMKKCWYRLGTAERVAENYEQASEYFTLAQDFQDAATQAQRMLYTLGHNAFLDGDYEAAKDWFSQLDGEPQDYGNPHFMNMAEAAPYLRQQLEELTHQISFHVSHEPTQQEWAALRNYLPFHAGTPSYYAEDQMVHITVTEYYPADRILAAWKSGDTSNLTEDEQQVLALALEVVEQAQSESDDAYELEFRLHDWLCQQVVYESPDMDVGVRDYVKLRQLSCVGAMLDGSANCQGYTDAFYLLGSLAGLEVTRLMGSAGDPHIWNMINLEDQWYIVDVTFDDLSDEEYDGWTYTYCNAAWDPDLYTIDGGAEALENIALESDIEKTWFGQNRASFDSLADAAEHLVNKIGRQDGNWCYALVENTDFTHEDLTRAIRRELTLEHIPEAVWLSYLEVYQGYSCISVCWDNR